MVYGLGEDTENMYNRMITFMSVMQVSCWSHQAPYLQKNFLR